MWIVSGGSDILFEALNAGRLVGKKLGGVDFFGGVHCFQILNGDTNLFIPH